jgi:hypothetical protein
LSDRGNSNLGAEEQRRRHAVFATAADADVPTGGDWRYVRYWCSRLHGFRRGCSSTCQVWPLLEYEADDMGQSGIIAQLDVLVARDAVGPADGGEQLGLLDGVDAEIGFQIQFQVQHFFRVTSLLDH